jgi:hypothetical protein
MSDHDAADLPSGAAALDDFYAAVDAFLNFPPLCIVYTGSLSAEEEARVQERSEHVTLVGSDVVDRGRRVARALEAHGENSTAVFRFLERVKSGTGSPRHLQQEWLELKAGLERFRLRFGCAADAAANSLREPAAADTGSSAPADLGGVRVLNMVPDQQDAHGAKTERAARRQHLNERLGAAFRAVFELAGGIPDSEHNPADAGFFSRLAENLRAYSAALADADQEYPRFRIRERLTRAANAGVPALGAAAKLLLSASTMPGAELAGALDAVQRDRRTGAWVAWLPYIFDQLVNSHRPPKNRFVIPDTTRDEWREAELAFGCILFSDDSFRLLQEGMDSAAAQVYAALKAGGHPVLSVPPARVRDMIGLMDPRALHWYAGDPPAFQLLEPPPPIEAIPRPEAMRRNLDEVWTAANCLQIALDKWMAWFVELQETGDAHPAVALNCDEVARRAIKVLVVHRPNVEPFDRADDATVLAMLPPIPAWFVPETRAGPASKHGDAVGHPRVRWQDDREFLDRYYWPPEQRHEQATKLRGAASQLIELLKTFPESALTTPRSKADNRSNPKAVHNADFTMVDWFGTEHHFALGVQSSAVQALWDEWERTGLGLHQETIRRAVDEERDNFRMDAAFRNHAAFGTMIRRCGDGRYKLSPPDDDPPPPAPKGKKSAGNAPKSRRKRA